MKENKNVPEIRFEGFTEEWEEVRLGDIVNIYDNLRVPVIKDLRISGDTPYYGANGIQDYVYGYTHDGEFVLLAEDGANSLIDYPVRYTQGKIWVNNHAHVISGKPKNSNTLFLSYNLKKVDYEKILVGGTRSKLTDRALRNIEVLIPPMSEQHTIGQYFEKLDSLITLHQEKHQKLLDLKKAMLYKLFPKAGETVPEIRFEGFSGEWEEVRLGDIVNIYDNLRVPVSKDLRISGDTPYYGANGIQDYVYGYTHDGEFVLLAEDGANSLIDYPVRYTQGKIWVNNHAHVISGKPKNTNTLFLSYNLKKVDYEKILVGGTRSKLTDRALRNIEVLTPPMSEQQAIGQYFEKLDEIIDLNKQKIDKLKNIKSALLDKMFV